MTVGDAIKICKDNEGSCTDCIIMELCHLTATGILAEEYKKLAYEENMSVKDVIDIEINELETRLELLKKLNIDEIQQEES